MKKVLALICVFSAIASIALAANDRTEADQKWLQIVEKKISSGQMVVSTPVQERVSILKKWASSKGYSTQVSQVGENFRIELSKAVAQR